jgi:hypothetical protein
VNAPEALALVPAAPVPEAIAATAPETANVPAVSEESAAPPTVPTEQAANEQEKAAPAAPEAPAPTLEPAPAPDAAPQTEATAPVAPVAAPVQENAAPAIEEPKPAEPVAAAPAVEETKPEPPPVEALQPPSVQDPAAPTAEPARVEAPPSGSWLQLAPLQDYSAATRAIQPAAPPAQILTPDSGPRMTLPGPALPPELARLQEAKIVTVLGDEPRRGKRGVPGWLISLVLMVGIPIMGAGILFYFQPLGHSSAEAKPLPPETPVATPPPTSQPVSQTPSHPLAQFIEVTGFRIVVDYNKKSEIHYLVINHSGAEISDVTVFVTLRAANAKQGQPPLCRFSFRAPAVGPFESKEMTSPIEKLSKSISLPEWQDLKSEIQIAP